jgi:hypothetical protein
VRENALSPQVVAMTEDTVLIVDSPAVGYVTIENVEVLYFEDPVRIFVTDQVDRTTPEFN